jgi:hypothetical protein
MIIWLSGHNYGYLKLLFTICSTAERGQILRFVHHGHCVFEDWINKYQVLDPMFTCLHPPFPWKIVLILVRTVHKIFMHSRGQKIHVGQRPKQHESKQNDISHFRGRIP